MNVIDLQKALNKFGHNAGAEDGLMGRVTLMVIKDFQKSRSLNPDGIVGPATLRELESALKKAPASEISASPASKFDIPLSMPWMHAAYNLMGTREVVGKGSNEAIRGWAEDLELTSYTDDDDAYHVLGGNQSNTVSVTRIAKSRLLTARWPSTATTVDSLFNN